MRKIVVSVQVTLDGFIEGANGDLSWMNLGGGIWQEVEEAMSHTDAVLFGRVAYEGFAAYWPAAADNPASPPDEVIFSRWIDDIPKFVVSTTLEEATWKNTRVIRDDIAGAITDLKNQPGKDILVFGGGGIISSLTRMGLIDDFQIHVFPLVLGGGIPLFRDIEDRAALRLRDVKRFDQGVVGLYYLAGERS